MTDLYLKTPTEDGMYEALFAAGIVDKGGNPTPDFSVDQIGPIYRFTGYDAKGQPTIEVYPEWHTNLRGSFTEEQFKLLAPLHVEPKVPYRVWA
jgi:hypothetical protein